MNEQQLRTRIREALEEYVFSSRQVIVTYDITEDYEILRTGILKDMEIYGSRMVTKSTYMLKQKLNLQQLTDLINSIKTRFESIRQNLNEQKDDPKKVKIVIITTFDNSFFEEVVIDEKI